MPAWLLPAATAAVGAVTSALGQKSANDANLKIAREQMSFQREMSNTSVRRRFADLEAAGINPMLAGDMSASTPGGASAQMQNVGASAPEAVSSARASLMAKKQLRLLDVQTSKTVAEGQRAHSEAVSARLSERMLEGRRAVYFEPSGRPRQALKDLAVSEHSAGLASSAQSISRAEIARLSIPEQKAMSELFESLGSSGKGVQTFMPLLLSLLRNR